MGRTLSGGTLYVVLMMGIYISRRFSLSPITSATSINTVFNGHSFVNHSLVLMIVITSFSPCVYKNHGCSSISAEDRHGFMQSRTQCCKGIFFAVDSLSLLFPGLRVASHPLACTLTPPSRARASTS